MLIYSESGRYYETKNCDLVIYRDHGNGNVRGLALITGPKFRGHMISNPWSESTHNISSTPGLRAIGTMYSNPMGALAAKQGIEDTAAKYRMTQKDLLSAGWRQTLEAELDVDYFKGLNPSPAQIKAYEHEKDLEHLKQYDPEKYKATVKKDQEKADKIAKQSAENRKIAERHKQTVNRMGQVKRVLKESPYWISDHYDRDCDVTGEDPVFTLYKKHPVPGELSHEISGPYAGRHGNGTFTLTELEDLLGIDKATA